jgi:hypothetical protein
MKILIILVAFVPACTDAVPSEPTTSFVPLRKATSELQQSDTAAADECLAARHSILDGITALVRDHAQGCATDNDCVLVSTKVACQSSCSRAVRKDHVLAFDDALKTLATRSCSSSLNICGTSALCMPATNAVCSNGWCEAAYPSSSVPASAVSPVPLTSNNDGG